MKSSRTGLLLISLLILLTAACSKGGPEEADAVPPPPSGIEEPDETKAPPGQEEPERPFPEVPEWPGAMAVVIENHTEAIPQAGIDRADLVFEADAIAGITRFLALFYHSAAEKIGPVRSARPFLIDLARGYPGAVYVHAGGSQEVHGEQLAALRRSGYPDLDEITNAGEAFYRWNERKAPHNLYTSTDRLVEAARRRNYELKPLAPPLTGPAPPGGLPSDRIELLFSNAGYRNDVLWSYVDGSYRRSTNGRIHRSEDGRPVQAWNLIVQFSESTLKQPADPYLDWRVTGTGDALFFRDGMVWAGAWSKEGAEAPLHWLQEDGSPFPLAEGPTWVVLLSSRERLRYGLASDGTDAEGGGGSSLETALPGG